jgi:lipopolysaccharide transport system permease protein
VPLSKVISNLFRFGIQLLILVGFYFYYISQGADIMPGLPLLLIPVYVMMMALYGLGFGMIVSTFTTKYRDLSILLGFATQLLMYLSAVPYPISELKKNIPEYGWVVDYNPLAQIIEGFRYVLFNSDFAGFHWNTFLWTLLGGLVVCLFGLILFNKTEKTFIDTV